MSVDPGLVGAWKREGDTSGLFYEISSTGIYLSYSPPCPYEISADGLTLTAQYPGETAVYDRQGDPATSLLGAWSRTHRNRSVETITFFANSSYTVDWDGSYWGVFLYDANEFVQGEFRGNVSTQGQVYTHDYDGQQTVFDYAFNGPDKVTFTDPNTGQVALVLIRV